MNDQPQSEQLTAEEARAEVGRLATELYKAQDAVAYAREWCDLHDQQHGASPGTARVTTGEVRLWLEGPKYGRQLAAAQSPTPAQDKPQGCTLGTPGTATPAPKQPQSEASAAVFPPAGPSRYERASEAARVLMEEYDAIDLAEMLLEARATPPAPAPVGDVLGVQLRDALWDAIATPGPRTATFMEQHERVCRVVVEALRDRPHVDVQGRCPACGKTSLFLGDGGYVTCSRLECPEPDAASTLLGQTPARDARPPLPRRPTGAHCVHCGDRYHPARACDPERLIEDLADARQTAAVLSGLHRSAEADVTRVIELHGEWARTGQEPNAFISFEDAAAALHAALSPKP